MKIIKKTLTLPGFSAIFLFGVLFVRPTYKINDVFINHESIHSKQYYELFGFGFIFLLSLSLFTIISYWWLLLSPFTFYILYGLEWLIRFFVYGFNLHKPYKNISFEREAYDNQDNLEYLKTRKIFSFFRYMGY